MFDLTIIVTLHNEGRLAHLTLLSIQHCVQKTLSAGYHSQIILVLDCPTRETRRVASEYVGATPDVAAIEVQHADLGLSRNSGVHASSGEYIAICDGDDYYSHNWFASALGIQRMAPDSENKRLILHPEYVVSFGAQYSYGRQVCRAENRNALGLFADNWWCAWTLGHRSIYLDVPYTRNDLVSTGFGFEDWHWNCETTARRFIHDIVPRTAAYYRRKSTGLLSESITQRVLPRPSRLFERYSAALGQ